MRTEEPADWRHTLFTHNITYLVQHRTTTLVTPLPAWEEPRWARIARLKAEGSLLQSCPSKAALARREGREDHAESGTFSSNA
jgi:hypothetical protein